MQIDAHVYHARALVVERSEAGAQASEELLDLVEGIDGLESIQYHICMKTITINVSEPVYADFQRLARKLDRSTSELVREAMEEYWQRWIRTQTTLAEVSPASVGAIRKKIDRSGLAEEMIHDGR